MTITDSIMPDAKTVPLMVRGVLLMYGQVLQKLQIAYRMS
jgi:hypothetical protein